MLLATKSFCFKTLSSLLRPSRSAGIDTTVELMKERGRTWEEESLKKKEQNEEDELEINFSLQQNGHDTRPIMWLNIPHLPRPGPPHAPARIIDPIDEAELKPLSCILSSSPTTGVLSLPLNAAWFYSFWWWYHHHHHHHLHRRVQEASLSSGSSTQQHQDPQGCREEGKKKPIDQRGSARSPCFCMTKQTGLVRGQECSRAGEQEGRRAIPTSVIV